MNNEPRGEFLNVFGIIVEVGTYSQPGPETYTTLAEDILWAKSGCK